MVKCLICGNDFEPTEDSKSEIIAICDNCAETRTELTNGKGDD